MRSCKAKADRFAERIITFLDSMPAERGGIMPTGYEYREYKNWRGIPKPRRCPFASRQRARSERPSGRMKGFARIAERIGPEAG